jgi:hypothetical protein
MDKDIPMKKRMERVEEVLKGVRRTQPLFCPLLESVFFSLYLRSKKELPEFEILYTFFSLVWPKHEMW